MVSEMHISIAIMNERQLVNSINERYCILYCYEVRGGGWMTASPSQSGSDVDGSL